MKLISLINGAYQKRKTTLDQLTADALKQVTGGSSGQKGVDPKTVTTVTPLTADALKQVTGGSSGQKGDDPKVATTTPVIQARDISYSGFNNGDEDKNP